MGSKHMGTQADAQAGGRAAAAKADDRATRDVLDAIRRIVRALRESSRAAEGAVGIGAAQLFVLHRLAASPALSLNELAAGPFTHRGSGSVVVSRLVGGGLLTRTRGGGRTAAASPSP